MFVLPAFRNSGIAQAAIKAVEKIHGDKNRCLLTILQEKGNCYFYEKMGYHAIGETKKINDRLTLIYYEKNSNKVGHSYQKIHELINSERGNFMIQNAYDIQSDPIITPSMFYGETKLICEICTITFSKVIIDNVLNAYPCKKVAELALCNGNIPIYILDYNNTKIAFYLSPIGSAVAGTCLEEVHCLTGAKKFIMFGSAGCLDQEATQGKIVVPTSAYRDEGLSYHYASAADYIEVPNAPKLAAIFDTLKVPYIMGKTWTTDALYRETRNHINERKKEGCLTVEMEVAGVQAVCSFHGFELYDFLMTGDVLDLPKWDIKDLSKANNCLENFYLALKISEYI